MIQTKSADLWGAQNFNDFLSNQQNHLARKSIEVPQYDAFTNTLTHQKKLNVAADNLEYSNLLHDLLKFDPFHFNNGVAQNNKQERHHSLNNMNLISNNQYDVFDYFKNLESYNENSNSFAENWNMNSQHNLNNSKLPNSSYSMPLIDQQQNILNINDTKKNSSVLNNRSDSGYISPKDWNNTNNKINLLNYTKTSVNDKRQDFWISSQCSSSQGSINSQNQFNVDEERVKSQQVNFNN